MGPGLQLKQIYLPLPSRALERFQITCGFNLLVKDILYFFYLGDLHGNFSICFPCPVSALTRHL